jgi:hypothetical protein
VVGLTSLTKTSKTVNQITLENTCFSDMFLGILLTTLALMCDYLRYKAVVMHSLEFPSVSLNICHIKNYSK